MLLFLSFNASYSMNYVPDKNIYECAQTGLQLLVHSKFNNVTSVELRELTKQPFPYDKYKNWEKLEILDLQRTPLIHSNTVITNKGTLYIPGYNVLSAAQWNGRILKLLQCNCKPIIK